MRQIDGDALKRRAQKVATEAWKMKIKAEVETILNQFIDWIDEAPTIQTESHWIPVTERLPEKSGEYLVTVKWVTGESDVDVYEYDARHKTWNDGESAGGERAVAWRELPEPYKGVTT